MTGWTWPADGVLCIEPAGDEILTDHPDATLALVEYHQGVPYVLATDDEIADLDRVARVYADSTGAAYQSRAAL